jgi:hypothetical protein
MERLFYGIAKLYAERPGIGKDDCDYELNFSMVNYMIRGTLNG